MCLNAGLLYFAQDQYLDAMKEYEQALALAQARDQDSYTFIDLDADILTNVVNNMAICALYCCDVKKAVLCLEKIIQQDPERHLQNFVVFNLCTLYDLACENTTSTRRKKILREVAERYELDHLDTRLFRIAS